MEDISVSLFGHTISKGSGNQFLEQIKTGDSGAATAVHFSQVVLSPGDLMYRDLAFAPPLMQVPHVASCSCYLISP